MTWSIDDELNQMKYFKDGEPCSPGCKHHVTHPCEKCGRTMARGETERFDFAGYVQENDIHYEQKEEVAPRGVSREDIDNLSSKPMERSYGRKKPAGMRIMDNYKLNQKVGDVIEKALLGYRCIHQLESNDTDTQGYPLTDALTPPWSKTIQEGREEIEHLTDHIFSQLEEAIKEGKIDPVGGGE